jgi:cation diffusion facilitator family transporter
MKERSRYFYAYLEGWVSIAINILLFALKYWAGIVSGSVAIIADAWHTLSDSISSIIVIFGAKTSKIPPDEEHPFGHGRAELISSLIIGVFLSVIAFNFLIESITRLNNHESATFGKEAIIAIVASIFLKEFLAQFAFWTSRKSKNNSLKADGWHHRSDAISSVVVLIGIFMSDYFWWIDGALGIIVAGLLFYASYEIFRDSYSPLLGEEPDKELIDKLIEIGKQVSEIEIYMHHFHLHNYGHHNELTFHIRLPDEMSIKEAHRISSKLERRIRKEFDMYSTIHFDPIDKKC